MIWGLGAGWDPFMSGQMGLFYPPFIIANVISDLLGAPLALLEVSLVMHQIFLGLFVMLWAPGTPREKSLLALCLVFLPGPFLLGMNWHAYGISHVWWAAAALLIHREANQERPFASLAAKLVLWAIITFFYQSAHPQMFVWGGGFLIVWIFLLYANAKRWRLLLILGLCALPIVPSLLYLKWLALQSSNLLVRPDNILLEMAQPFSTAILGGLIGNLGNVVEMTFFTPKVYWDSAGLLFQPALFIVIGMSLYRKQILFFLFALFCLALLGAKSFPWLGDLNLGPLNNFRWTFKVVVITGPFFLMALYFQLVKAQKIRLWLFAAIALASLTICYEGRSFDLMSETYLQKGDAGTLVKQTQTCLEAAQIPPGARLSMVGNYNKATGTQSKIMVGLSGNAVTLFGMGATHVNEPMEPDYLADGHLRLAGRQYNPLNNELFRQQSQELIKALRYIGATHLFTVHPQILPKGTTTHCTDEEGHHIYFQKIQQARPGLFPQPHDPQNHTQVSSSASGVLSLPADLHSPLQLNTTAPISWQMESGQQRGYPNPINPIWGCLIALLSLVVGYAFWRFL